MTFLTPKCFWSLIWTSHTYGILKLYNVNIHCYVTFWQIAIARSLGRLHFLISTQNIWKDFAEDFKTSSIKREYSISMKLLKGFKGTKFTKSFCNFLELLQNDNIFNFPYT